MLSKKGIRKMLVMRRAPELIMLLAAAILLTGCSPSKEEVSKQVESMFQKRLSSEAGVADLHAIVSSVTLIKDQGNRYEGVAIVTLDGKAHEVPVKVLADGKSVMYEAEPTALSFLLEAQMKKLFPPPSSHAAPVRDAAMPAEVKQLAHQWDALNEACRGGSGDSPATTSNCEARDKAYEAIQGQGWCWGHKDDIGADRRWVRCAPGDT